VAIVLAACGATGSSATERRSSSTTTAAHTTTASTITTTASQSSSGKPRIVDSSFHSVALDGTIHYSIAFPPGYDSSGKRYPVIYFLHGLPATDQSYKGIGVYADSLAATGHSAIVVGAQGARPGDTDPEWHNWGPGRDWETATESELVSWIDDHYRTLARRSARAIIGVSAGGYGATLIAIHHPETYQVIESWSGYFVLTDPDGNPKDLGSAEANADASAHASVPQLKERFSPYGRTFFGFYIGAQDPYPGFVQDNERLDSELDAADIPHVFELYQGAHSSSFWREHQDEWLGAAVERLDPPS
jgi:enterochelin esterase-like enzyme